MTQPRCEFESVGPVESLLEKYDPARDAWSLPRDGELWEALKSAHAEGLRGQGRRVAVIDTPCDYRIPRLARQTGGRPVRSGPAGEPTGHGTLVALLVGAAAPECRIDMYEISRNGQPDLHAVLAALKEAARSEADIVCLSLGVPSRLRFIPEAEAAQGRKDAGWFIGWSLNNPERLPLLPENPPCPVCRAAEEVVAAGKMLFAAAGNSSGSTFCPSRSDKAVAIGFQLVHRFLDSALGGQWEPALASLPSYDQSVTVDFSVKQIEGALGSSFACPLAAGAAALGIRRVHLNELLQSCRYGSYADLFQASLGGRPTRDMVNATMSLYQLALSRNPLRDSSLDDPIDRLECAIFSVPLFINYGLMLMCTGNIPMAESLLRRARRFAPWDPNGAANLGRLCQLKAEEAINMATGFVSPIFYLKEAESLYVEALRLRPGMTIYEAQLAEIRRLMMRNPS